MEEANDITQQNIDSVSRMISEPMMAISNADHENRILQINNMEDSLLEDVSVFVGTKDTFKYYLNQELLSPESDASATLAKNAQAKIDADNDIMLKGTEIESKTEELDAQTSELNADKLVSLAENLRIQTQGLLDLSMEQGMTGINDALINMDYYANMDELVTITQKRIQSIIDALTNSTDVDAIKIAIIAMAEVVTEMNELQTIIQNTIDASPGI